MVITDWQSARALTALLDPLSGVAITVANQTRVLLPPRTAPIMAIPVVVIMLIMSRLTATRALDILPKCARQERTLFNGGRIQCEFGLVGMDDVLHVCMVQFWPARTQAEETTAMQSYATVTDDLTIDDVLAASRTVDTRTNQRELLLSTRTYRQLLIAGAFINLPQPAPTISRVAIAGPGINLGDDATAEVALTVAGVQLAVDERTLTVGAHAATRGTPLAYQMIGPRSMRLTAPAQRRSLALVDAIGGYGVRRNLHGEGTWSALPVGEYELTQTGANIEALPDGTTISWDRESMVIRSSETSGNVTTYTLERDDESAHESTDELWQNFPPSDLAHITKVIAKRLQGMDEQPAAGPNWTPDGDATPSIFRNTGVILSRYQRPNGA